MRHAPAWQLMFPGRPAGTAISALAWLGPERAPAAIPEIRRRLPAGEVAAVLGVRRVYRHGWLRLCPHWRIMPDLFLSLSPDDRREALSVASAASGLSKCCSELLRMIEDGLLADDAESFAVVIDDCASIEYRANRGKAFTA